jgi:hypothetical protein
MSPERIRRAFERLLDAFARSSGDSARAHARLVIAMMTECPWLTRQASPEVLSRVFASSGYLPAERSRAA